MDRFAEGDVNREEERRGLLAYEENNEVFLWFFNDSLIFIL